ncbi:MAG: DUF4062 domain-containing protein [Pseudomonadota bacterium]
MATSQKIRVMLSSKCKVGFSRAEKQTLTDIRRELKRDIENQRLLGFKPFEVWINEDAEALDHTDDSWDACLKQVQECDILIVLYNGDAGWAKSSNDIGICQAEYAEGIKHWRGKVRLLALPMCEPTGDPAQDARNASFAEFSNKISAFRGGEISTVEELNKAVRKTLFDAVLTQTRRGADGSKADRFDLGAALEWSRLDYAARRLAMENEVRSSLVGRRGSQTKRNALTIEVEGVSLLVKVHAVPAAMSVAPAREAIGRPHLNDHKLVDELGSSGGPLHIIACHRTVTETQATNLLGFPDATVVSGRFGVYLVDDVQKVQFVFLANCRDSVQTRLATQRFFEWLDQAAEGERMATRAKARARIVSAIAKEQSTSST